MPTAQHLGGDKHRVRNQGTEIMIMGDWQDTSRELPGEGRLVEVPNNGGMKLYRSGNLWFLPDGSMYVYFTPQHWRYAA